MSFLRKTTLLIALGIAGVVTAAASAVSQSQGGAVYYGSSKSDKYHIPSCQWAQKIASGNLVIFKSKDAAAAKGYQPCKVCKP